MSTFEKPVLRILQLATLGLLMLVQSSSATAQDKPKPVRVIEQSTSEMNSETAFCANIKDPAQEQRYAIKTRELNELKAAVEQRIITLEKRRAEFESWQKKRDEFAAMAQGNLIEIYSKMRPDAAAGRLEMLTEVLAASILLKMPPRKASVILNEMKAEKAAGITQVIAASGDIEKKS